MHAQIFTKGSLQPTTKAVGLTPKSPKGDFSHVQTPPLGGWGVKI